MIVAPGEHRVLFRYSVPGLGTGMAFSGLGLVDFAAVASLLGRSVKPPAEDRLPA